MDDKLTKELSENSCENLVNLFIDIGKKKINEEMITDNFLIKELLKRGNTETLKECFDFDNTTVPIFVKYVSDIKPICKEEYGDWIDLRSAEDIELEQGEYYELHLGIAVELPENYCAIIAPRSSTYKKWGIICVNSIGIIDNSYKGDNDEWKFPILAMRKTHIHKNDRICQFRLLSNVKNIDIRKVYVLANEDRKGLGSTGTV